MSNNIVITKMEFPDNVRNNVGMYLGNVIDFTTPLREIINNSTDELINGYASWVEIINREDLKAVIDNGRGMPIYEDPDLAGESIAKAAVGSLHAGSKFNNVLEVTSGVHGVGSAAVNAVSEEFILAVKIDEKKNLDTAPQFIKDQYKSLDIKRGDRACYFIQFNRGLLTDEGVCTLSSINEDYGIDINSEFSTAVIFKPDLELYNSGKAKIPVMSLQVVAHKFPKASITVDGDKIKPFSFKNEVAKGSELFLDKEIPFEFKFKNTLSVSGILAYDKNTVQHSHDSLINLIETTQGGILADLVVRSFGYALNKHNSALSYSDAKLGLIIFTNSFTSYKCSYASQTKERLIGLGLNTDKNIIERMMAEGKSQEEIDDECYKHVFYSNTVKYEMISFFEKLIKKNSEYFDAVCNKLIEYKRQMNKLSNKEFVKSKLVFGNDSDRRRNTTIASKVYEATSNKYELRELYITEGLSASSGLIKYRNPKYQSVLPLRGKVLNSTTLDDVDVINNAELLAMVNTVGCGLGELTDITQARYGKIIVSTDSDSDGSHIANLIIAMFMTHCPETIKAGMLYKLEPPYYVVTDKKGKVSYYSLSEKDQIDFENSHVEKRKGLGSYKPEEIKRFMIDPETRFVTKIIYDDESAVEEASRLLYSSSARRDLMIRRGVL